MSNIEISETLWSRISDEEKAEVIDHLKKHKLLMDGGTIIGNTSITESTEENFLDDLNPLPALCKIACDAMRQQRQQLLL